MTVHLPQDLEQYVRMKVQSGLFASEEEVIREAVRLLRDKDKPSLPERRAEPGAAEPAWKRVLDIMDKVPEKDFERVPADGSEQLDHYIYGTPKRTC